MKISPFLVEEWMNEFETLAKYNVAETCVDSVSMDELFEIAGADRKAFLDELSERRLTYGDIVGKPEFRRGIAQLFRTASEDDVVTTNGASGANYLALYSVVEPGDEVVCVMPTYQQLYSIPESFGANVRILRLTPENDYLPDLDELKAAVSPRTKLICINNPNNPTGALIPNNMLARIAEIADGCGAYLLCDEVYRHLTQGDAWSDSVIDIYDKGISTGSMSKVFSLAGLRLGWVATRDAAVKKALLSHRDYNMISCGMIDEALAALALANKDKLLARSLRIVRENLGILDKWVESEQHISYVKPSAGTTALVNYDFDMDSFDFCKALMRDTGALVTPSGCFGEPRGMRVGYACDTEELKEGLAAISRFMEGLK